MERLRAPTGQTALPLSLRLSESPVPIDRGRRHLNVCTRVMFFEIRVRTSPLFFAEIRRKLFLNLDVRSCIRKRKQSRRSLPNYQKNSTQFPPSHKK